MAKKLSLLVIADISGFTQFIRGNEISHSRHIIAELMEVLIDADPLHLTVAEIEGDAVLFYRYNALASRSEVVLMAERLFVAFHEHLRQYESSRVCQCGACVASTSLSLKILVHVGQIELLRVKQFRKPFGEALIWIHLLLKNTIPQREYLLLSSEFLVLALPPDHVPDPAWIEIFEGATSYQDVGSISYSYISLSPLRAGIKEPFIGHFPKLTENPLVVTATISKPAAELHALLVNLSIIPEWEKSIQAVRLSSDKINRSGTRHLCVSDSGLLNFETLQNPWPDKLVYGQRIRNERRVRDLFFYIILEPIAAGTSARIELHYKPWPLIGWLLERKVRKRFTRFANELLNSLSQNRLIAEIM